VANVNIHTYGAPLSVSVKQDGDGTWHLRILVDCQTADIPAGAPRGRDEVVICGLSESEMRELALDVSDFLPPSFRPIDWSAAQ
jgi:hypothetical protein